MSSIDLVVLGLLERRPQSAYDLAKEIQRYELDGVVRLSIPAVYKNVKRLEERRFLESSETRRGEMPEKTMYRLTERGREHFLLLMEQHAAERVRYRFDFNSVVLHLDKVPRKRRALLLKRLKEQLEAGQQELSASLAAWQEKSAMAELMRAQVELVGRALGEWIDAAMKKV